MKITAERWQYLVDYSRSVFGAQDDVLADLLRDAAAEGLPDIAVGPEMGRLLAILTALTPARLAVEVGTLGGYSAIWIARALAPGGKLVTIEIDPRHAVFARRFFRRAGVADRVDLRVGAALSVLPDLAREIGPASADVVFLDAVKTEYPDYWRLTRALVAPGGLLLADNVFGSNWWIGDEGDATRRAVDRFNRMVAADAEFETVAVPLRQGLLIARRRGAGR